MSKTIIFRLITPVLFTRVTVPQKGTISDLKYAVQTISQIPYKDQELYLDNKYQNKIGLKDDAPIAKLNLREGDAIFLKNTPPKKTTEDTKSSSLKCNHGINEVCINCIDKKKKEIPEKKKSVLEEIREKNGLTAKCTHKPGQKCLHCMKAPEYKGELKYTCQHGEGGKCPNCVGKEFIGDAKHKSFDQYINERKEKCKGTHELTSICINCMPPSQVEYKMKPNCPNHPPYPDGVCNKCMPPNVFLNRQVYRHVDYVSFMNSEEIELFLQSWIKGFYQKQKMGYLFGYYAEDPNYPNGVRAIVEALYEPPQIGDETSVEPQRDSDIDLIDQIANSLGFECIGWIFTSLKEKDICLTSYDIRKAARYQLEYPYIHSSGCKISRFITCVVKPSDTGECSIEAYMVSDMCQALERDNIFDNLRDKQLMQVRKPKKNELLPTIYMENKPSDRFDPDFFIVNLGHGVPQSKRDMNILKSYDFPVASRTEKGIVTEQMIKDYFKRHKGDLPLVKCANFYFLLFLAKTIDVNTACTYGNQIADGFIDWEIVESILSSYIGYS